MNILEAEIEDVVWDAITKNPNQLVFADFPYDSHMTYVRQFELANYGRCDLVGFSVWPMSHRRTRIIDISIIELKKGVVNVDTLFQAVRYAKGLKELFAHKGWKYHLEFHIHLIGKLIDAINESDFIYLPGVFPNVSLWTYEIHLETGLQFQKQENYCLSDPGFSENEKKLFPILKANLRSTREYKLPDDLPF